MGVRALGNLRKGVLFAISTAALAMGCAVETADKANDAAQQATVPAEGALVSVGASEQTNADLGVTSFDVHQAEEGRLRVYAIADNKEVRGIFDVARLDESGAVSQQVEATRFIEYNVTYPAQGMRTIEPGSDAVLTNTLETGSIGERLVEAFSADISGIAPDSALQSTAAPLNPQYLACMTDTKCYGVVLWCKDKCCNAYDYNTRKWVGCTTIRQYPCGGCVGFPW
jgi:hypothetical protein